MSGQSDDENPPSISKYIPTEDPNSGAQLANILPKVNLPRSDSDEE